MTTFTFNKTQLLNAFKSYRLEQYRIGYMLNMEYITKDFVYQNNSITLKTFKWSSMNLRMDVIEPFLTYSQVNLIDIDLKIINSQPLTFFEFLCFYTTTNLLHACFNLNKESLLDLHGRLMSFIVKYQMCLILYRMAKLNHTWYNDQLLFLIKESNSKKTLLFTDNIIRYYPQIKDFISFGIKRHDARIKNVLPSIVFQIEQNLNIIVDFKTLFNKFVTVTDKDKLIIINPNMSITKINVNYLVSTLLEDDNVIFFKLLRDKPYQFTNQVKQYLKELEIPFRILNICYIFEQQATIRILKTIFNIKHYTAASNLLNKGLPLSNRDLLRVIHMLNEATESYYSYVMHNKDLLRIIINHFNISKSR